MGKDIEELDLSEIEGYFSPKKTLDDKLGDIFAFISSLLFFILISVVVFSLWCILMDSLLYLWGFDFSFVDYFRGVIHEQR